MTRSIALLILLLALGACKRPSKEAQEATDFEIRDAWVRADPDSGTTTAAYMRFVNGLQTPITVSDFESHEARAVELHETHISSGGAASMKMLQSLTIGAKETMELAPGGYHMMLVGITEPLTRGKMVRMSMHLSNGSIISSTARVR